MKKYLKIIIPIGIALLLIIVLQVTLQFSETGKKIYLNDDEEIKEEQFVNNSNLSEEEISNIVLNKRNSILDFLKEAKYYNISEISEDYQKSDDELYIVLDDKFLDDFQQFLTIDLYTQFTRDFELINTIDDVKYFKANHDVFDNLFFNSALESLQITDTKINLKTATNDRIESSINIKICEEDNSCSVNKTFNFTLVKVDGDFKISKIK